MLIIALAVKLTSSGPVFYTSERVGYKRSVFKLLKFRTMQHNAPKIIKNSKTFVDSKDSRLTVIGSFLRIGFDELPQLINVVKSDITLIGPRPNEGSFLRINDELINKKFEVLPGITGLAVVCNGRRLSIEDNLMLDVWYSQNRSIMLDMLIFIMTPLYMMGFKTIGARLLRRVTNDWKNAYPDAKFDSLLRQS